MAMLLNQTITTALTAVASTALQVQGQMGVESVTVQANFTYGSGGTNATVYIQTSLDGGTTWVDIACWQFTTSSLRQVANLSALTPVTTLYTATDAALTVNTAKDGVIGNLFRTKTTTTGTYATSTTLRVDLIARGRLTSLS